MPETRLRHNMRAQLAQHRRVRGAGGCVLPPRHAADGCMYPSLSAGEKGRNGTATMHWSGPSARPRTLPPASGPAGVVQPQVSRRHTRPRAVPPDRKAKQLRILLRLLRQVIADREARGISRHFVSNGGLRRASPGSCSSPCRWCRCSQPRG
jgi:hypothetical protein